MGSADGSSTTTVGCADGSADGLGVEAKSENPYDEIGGALLKLKLDSS